MLVDYKVKRTEDCALMDVNRWIPTSNIVAQSIKGNTSPSYVTEVLDENFKKDYGIYKGDYILITQVASEIAPMRSYQLLDRSKYFNLPVSQIIGRFRSRQVSWSTLELIEGRVLVERIEKNESCLVLPKKSDMLGKVVSVNSKISSIKRGSAVLLKDNIVTPIRLDGKEYYAADDTNIVGVLNHGSSLEDIEFINESVLMVPHYDKYLFGSKVLITPDINYEDLDYSDINNRDLFQIKFLDRTMEGLKKEDIVLARRDYTNYVYINDIKYFLLNGKKWIEAKITE